MKHKLSLWAFLPLFLISGVVNAQMDNLANLSAKWISTNTRNATLDGGGDMVNFNPAGLALLKDGIYVSLSNQSMFRHPKHTFNMGAGNQSFEQDKADLLLPMLYAAYKKNNWAISSGAYISGGGGTADYPEGSINTVLMGYQMRQAMYYQYGYNYPVCNNQSIKATSFYLTIPLAFSYAINDKLALSAGGRFIRGINHTQAGLTLTGSNTLPDYVITVDYKSNASGFGGVFGVDFKPNDKWNIAIHYETKVKLKFEADDNKGSYILAADGAKSDRDLPATINTGISYKITDKLTAAVDFNWYFQSKADWDSITDPRTAYRKSASKVAGDCFKTGAGLTYQMNDKFQIGAGFCYTGFRYDDQELYYTKMGLYEVVKYDNVNVGLGVGYNVTKNIEADLSLGRTFWKDKTINSLNASGMPVKVSDKAYVVALGLDFRL
jgi:long-chain fatty acid transport protein